MSGNEAIRGSLERRYEADWRTAEIFMSIAKNPDMRDFSLFLLKQIGKLTMADPRFRDFAGGVFSGVISQSAWLVPRALYHAFPRIPRPGSRFSKAMARTSMAVGSQAQGIFFPAQSPMR